MTDCNLEKIDVRYSQSRSWLFLHVFSSDQSVSIRMLDRCDPIPDLINWLEAISADVMEDSLIIDGEGIEEELKFVNRGNDQIMLVIGPANCSEQYVQVRAIVNKRQAIEAFYGGLKNFANSDSYKPEDWEIETMEDRLLKTSGKDTEQVLDELAALAADDLEKLFFSVAPGYQVSWPALGDDAQEQWKKSMDFFDDQDNKEHELGMKTTPIEWKVDKDYDSWSLPWRKTYLQKYIQVSLDGHEGTKLKKVHSPTIEAYLNSE